jgi:hypothetical protein
LIVRGVRRQRVVSIDGYDAYRLAAAAIREGTADVSKEPGR